MRIRALVRILYHISGFPGAHVLCDALVSYVGGFYLQKHSEPVGAGQVEVASL